MKRLAITISILMLVWSAASRGEGAGARDDVEATISALRTEVADLEATSQARGDKVNRQRTRIAELSDGATSGTPSAAFDLEGVHDAKIYQRFAAGAYSVGADCELDDMQVYVLDADHGIVAQPVSRSAAGEAGDLRADLTADGEYKVEVYCEGRWRVTFTEDPP